MTEMAEFENAIRVRLKTSDGQQMLPQTSADMVVGLTETVKDTVISESVHIETALSEIPEPVKVQLSDGISVITDLERDEYGHVKSYTIGELTLQSLTPNTVAVKENDTVVLKNDGAETGVIVEGRGAVTVDVENGILVIEAQTASVKLYSNETDKGWLTFASDGSIKPGMIYEEV